MRRAVGSAVGVGALIVALALPGIAQAASFPSNDDFLRQQVVVADELASPGSSMATATSEPGEPSHGATGAVRSAWWSWTALRSGVAEVQSCSNAFTPLLGLYAGFDVAQLTAVPVTAAPARCQLPSSSPYGSARRFHAVAGTTYRIATATDSPAEGYANVAVQTRPAGDDFADAAPLPVDVDEQNLALGLATVQPGEPAHGGRSAIHSAWYAHTPVRRERVRIDACYANYSPVSSTATIYRGSAIGSLTAVASSRDAAGCGFTERGGQVEAILEAGVEFRIAVTQDDPTAEPVRVRITRSPHDDSATTPSKLSAGWTVDLALATAEPGEPAHAGQVGGRSRWKVVTPEQTTTYEVSTCPDPYPPDGPPPDTLLAVYEGAPGTSAEALTPVTANDDGCPSGSGSLVRFRALAGHRYLVAIDSKGGAPGTVQMNVVTSPPGDDRDSAVRFDGRAGSFSNVLATAQPGEPAHAGSPASHSVWYRWVAPRSGNARVALCGATFDAVLAVYAVDPAQLALAAAGATADCDSLAFGATGTGPHFDMPVIAGRTYLIAVDGRAGATGLTGPLSVTFGAVSNDDVADAISLADPDDADGSGFGASAAATAQPGEPAHAGRTAEHSSWWRWTSTRTGFVTLSSCSTFPEAGDDTTLAVYTGQAVADLQPVAAADGGCAAAGGAGNAKLSFYALEGTVYRIAVDVHGTTAGARVELSLPPANDRFSKAREATAAGFGSANLGAATREPGEPDHAGRTGGRSVWYGWTSARTELVEIYTCADVDTLLGVYTGTAVDALHEVASNDDSSANPCGYDVASRVRFLAQAGSSYRIAIDGKEGATGSVNLSVRTPAAADAFATAQQLAPRPESADVDLILTSAEAGEPAHGGRPAVRSSWLRFTPISTHVVEASSCSTSADTVLAAYTGADLATLSPVAADDAGVGCLDDAVGARIRFRATAGVTYSIAVDASAPARGQVAIRLLPGNDDLADAAPLTLTPGTVVADSLAGATREGGEPEHGAGPTAVSAWYRVHVDSARTVRLSVCPISPDVGSSVRLAAYTGGSVADLQPVADAVSSGCYKSAAGRLAFAAAPARDVLVAVAAPGGHEYELRVEEVPVNDMFAAATPISDRGGGERVGEAAHAGNEPGEPRHAGAAGGHSLWWSYTPTTDRAVRLHGCSEERDPLLAVYTGSAVDALTPVAIGIARGSPYYCANLSFAARAGVTYRVALDVEGGGPGPLSLELTPQLPNHTSFAAPAPVEIPSRTLDDLARPGPEPGEPAHAGLGRTASVWYRLDPVQDELLDISSCGFNGADTVVAVYTGVALGALTEVAANDEDEGAVCSFGNRDAHVAVPLRGGAVYWVAVDSATPASSGQFELFVSRRASHDAFADPFELVPGVPVTAWTGTASAEPGEPAHDGARAARSVWTAWTADRSGRAVVEACASEYARLTMAAYTGENVDALTPVASNDDAPACLGRFPGGARLELDVVAGQRYHVAVDERFEYSAANVTLHVAPANDDRATAAALPAPGAGADVDLTAAGTEAGEPQHAGVRGGGSAWYRIAPAITAGLEVDTCATAGFDSVLAVYRLGIGDVLTPVAAGDDAVRCGSAGKGARMGWRAEAGNTYLVAVAGAGAQRGPAHLDVRSIALPAPDTRLTGSVPRRTAATTVSVGFESDTPGATFECRSDRETEWTACVSPVVRSGLREGDHSVAVRATAGGVADPAPEIAAFTVDRTAPEPSLASPAAGAVVRPGEVTYDGTCAEQPGDRAEVTVRIWRGDTTAGTPQVSAVEPCDPYFAYFTMLTEEGPYTIVLTQDDDVGNTGSTAPRLFTVQGATPTVHLDAPSEGTVTNSRRPTFSGRVSDAADGPVTVHVQPAGAGPGDPDVQTLSAPVSSGTFTVVPTVDLVDGGYRVRAEQSGPGGVTGSSGTSGFVVDLTAPAVAITTPADGTSTRDDSIGFAGSAESGGDVVLTAVGPGATSAQRTAAVTSSAWSTSFPGLSEGEHVVTARQTDAAGNVGSSAPRTIRIDRTAPQPVILVPQDGADVPAGSVTVSGTAGGLGSDADSVVLALRRQDGTSMLTRDVAVEGTSWRTAADLPAGSYSAHVRQADAAGNVGDAPARAFTVSAPSPGPTPATPATPATPPPQRAPPATPGSRPTRPSSPPIPDAMMIADGLLPGRGAVALPTDDSLDNRLFLVPGSEVRLRPTGTQLVGAAVCPRTCAVQIQAAVKLRGQRGKAVRTRRLSLTAGPSGRTLRIALDAALRRRITRARGATATITIRYVDALGAAHRVTAKLRLLPAGG